MPLRGTVGEIRYIGKEKLSVEWSITNIFSLTGQAADWYESFWFELNDGNQWKFRMFPNGIARDSSGWVDLCLERISGTLHETRYITLGIKGAMGVENRKGRGQKFSPSDCKCWWLEFCSRHELSRNKSRLMPGDKLTITCTVKRCLTTDVSTQTEKEFLETEDSTEKYLSSRVQGIEKAIDDIGKLKASGENSDVIVQVGGVEFKAHRLILSARSPVLYGMLKKDISNRISISDCDPNVFKEFLHFLYTGSVQHLSEQNAFCLYQIAVKYSADDLKRQCLEHIRNTLCVKTFCNTVHLALTHEENDLLKLAIAFAVKNIHLILLSSEWQNFISEYPAEANEIFIKCSFPMKTIFPTKSKFNKRGFFSIILGWFSIILGWFSIILGWFSIILGWFLIIVRWFSVLSIAFTCFVCFTAIIANMVSHFHPK